jgi:opacity protein-like surface antigen
MKTIKYLLAVALFIVSVTGIGAQANYGDFRWGLKAGANFANVNNSDNVEKEKGKTRFVGGAFCKIPLTFYLSVRPELLFNMKGATLNFPSDVVGQTDNIEYSLNYLELPVSVDFDLPFFLDFHAGVQGALLLSNTVKINGSGGRESDDIEKGEFGWHIGAGFDLGNLGLHVRYQQSLTPFYDGTTFGAGQVELKNWGITLTAAYMFP